MATKTVIFPAVHTAANKSLEAVNPGIFISSNMSTRGTEKFLSSFFTCEQVSTIMSGRAMMPR